MNDIINAEAGAIKRQLTKNENAPFFCLYRKNVTGVKTAQHYNQVID